MIVIRDYDPTWPEQFALLARVLSAALPDGATIHHIGSTAVPGLGAKDIIDLQATVLTLDEIDAQAVFNAGFAEVPGMADHRPALSTLAANEFAKRFFRSTGRAANLHVRQAGRFNQRYPLLCRDYLRAHPVTAASYEVIKRHLATWFPDYIHRYYDVKDPLFDVIIDGAEIWAGATGWIIPDGDDG